MDRNVYKAVNDRVYASAWLYIALTTVNGWRPSDLHLLPQIDIGFLGVNSLDTFLYRTLSTEETMIIIDQNDSLKLTQYEVSKTQFRRNFYVNESLKEAMATAYAICQFHSLIENDGAIIHFNTKHNQPYKRVWKMFFGDKRFIDFNTLKMNRSLIMHLYNNIKDKTGDSYLAYELARALRNHEAPDNLDEYEFSETTKIYIRQVSKEGFIDNALVELFDRGEFGLANIQRDRSVIHSLMEKIGEAIHDFSVEYVGNYIDLGSLQKQLGKVSERIKSIERMQYQSTR